MTTPAEGLADGQTDRWTDRCTDKPKTRWRGPKYILGHTDLLINDKHVFCECQYLYILRQKNNDNSYFYKNSRLSFPWVPYYLKLIILYWPICEILDLFTNASSESLSESVQTHSFARASLHFFHNNKNK